MLFVYIQTCLFGRKKTKQMSGGLEAKILMGKNKIYSCSLFWVKVH